MYQQAELFSRTLKPSFHNTIELTGKDLERRELKADSQNAKILDLFQRHPHASFTPCDVFQKFGQQWPITSIRRAITTLTDQQYLVKTSEKRRGMYGEMNYTWKLKP